jgi:N-acetylglucosamine-6-phosphate deacetylase
MKTIHAKQALIDGNLADDAFISVENGIITGIDSSGKADRNIENILLPGFIDIHCHGGGGFYFSDENPAHIREIIAIHRKFGTTSINASLVTAQLELIKEQIKRLKPFVKSGEILGIQLEGPFLSKDKCGAHDPELLIDPKISILEELLAIAEGSISMVTLAPELPSGIEAIKCLVSNGVKVAIGHSNASYEIGKEALAAGASIYTHFWNATPTFDLNKPTNTLATAALEDPKMLLEFINDGVHLNDEIYNFLLDKFSSRLISISDAMSAAGAGDGQYLIGALDVLVKDGVARLTSNNSLAGSTLTLNRSYERLVARGVNISEASKLLSANPASAMGKRNLGSIKIGMKADFVEVTESKFVTTL